MEAVMLRKFLKIPHIAAVGFVAAASLTAAAGIARATPVLTVIKSLCYTGTSCSGAVPTANPQELIADSSGNYFGVTATGGTHGHGQAFKILKLMGGGYSYVPIYDFCPSSGCADGSGPVGKLIIDTSGNLYGMTADGGGCTPKPTIGCGTIFELSPPGTGTTYLLTTLWTFCSSGSTCPGGQEPGAGLTYAGWPGSAYDGSSTLFGTTDDGGSGTSAQGIAFKLTGVGGTPALTDIHDFCSVSGCTDGATPDQLVVDGSGDLFGVAHSGGSCPANISGCGVAFELSPSGGSYSYTTLYTFCPSIGCADGQSPDGQLVITSTNKLVGTTAFGGANDDGTVFRITPNGASSTETVRYSFCSVGGGACTDGSLPQGGVFQDANGKFYGVTAFGGANQLAPGGTVWKLSGTTLTTLYSFCPAAGCADGNLPQASVVYDSVSGDLFGTTTHGGANNGGVVFDLTP
jgi:uncharacterized repeat protein (TIGR03803 family)